MPSEDVDLRVRTRGARQAARDADRVGNSVGRIGSRARRSAGGMRLFTRATASAGRGLRLTAGAAAYGGAAIGGALLLELKRSTDAWQEKRKIVAQTGAVLRSTGGAAGVTAGQVDKLANSLSRKSGMDDEAIRDAENLLLTFRDVRNEAGRGNDVFTQATKVTTDLAAGMHMDLRKAALQVGKALNDPERGFKRLQRIGVAFSATQEQQIKHFSAVGDRAAAQRVILGELRKEFGGSAAAQATALDRLKVSWGNIEEAIGKGAAPAVDAIATRFDHFFVKAEPQLNALGDRLGKIFRRKDIGLDEQLSLAGADIRRTTAPMVREIRREIGAMHLGDKMGQAFDRAAPAIGDAAARAAPRAARAFIGAWWNMGFGGKLFSLAVLAGKLGAFSSLGRMAAARFLATYGPAVAAGEAAAGGVPGAGGAAGKAGKLARLGRTLPWVGTAIVAGELTGEALHDTGVGRAARRFVHTDPASERGRGRARMRSQGRVQVDIGGGNTAWMSTQDARGWRRDHRPRTTAPRASGATVSHTTVVKIGEREVARANDRFHADQRARNRERRDRRR